MTIGGNILSGGVTRGSRRSGRINRDVGLETSSELSATGFPVAMGGLTRKSTLEPAGQAEAGPETPKLFSRGQGARIATRQGPDHRSGARIPGSTNGPGIRAGTLKLKVQGKGIMNERCVLGLTHNVMRYSL